MTTTARQKGHAIVRQFLMVLLQISLVGCEPDCGCDRKNSWSCEPSENQGVEMWSSDDSWPITDNRSIGCYFGHDNNDNYSEANIFGISGVIRFGFDELPDGCEGIHSKTCQKVVVAAWVSTELVEGETIPLPSMMDVGDETFPSISLHFPVVDAVTGEGIDDYWIPETTHYLLTQGEVITEHLYPPNHVVRVSMHFVPNPKYADALKELGLWREWIEIEATCDCIPTIFHSECVSMI